MIGRKEGLERVGRGECETYISEREKRVGAAQNQTRTERKRATWRGGGVRCVLAFTRYYCFSLFEALLIAQYINLFVVCKHVSNTPFIVQYIAQYYQLLHHPPRFEVFLRSLEVFLFFRGRILDGSRC